MAEIHVERETLAAMLRSHGEDQLAKRVGSLTDNQMMRIARLGAYYAWSEDAIALDARGSMGGARALSLATIDVVEGSGRPLHRYLAFGDHPREDPAARPDPVEEERDRELRRRAAKMA